MTPIIVFESLKLTPALAILLVTLIIAYLIWFYQRVRKYPNGPTPLPILGNLLLIGKQVHLYKFLSDAYRNKTYKDPITLWFGDKPALVVNSAKTFQELNVGPKRNHFGGRRETNMGNALKGNVGCDISFSDYSPQWNELRKVSHVAIRKYARSPALQELCREMTDWILDESIHIGDFNGMVDVLLQNIVGVSLFGQRFERVHPHVELHRTAVRRIDTEAPNCLPSDVWAPLGILYWKTEKTGRQYAKILLSIVDSYYDVARQSYTPGQIRHFVDALTSAREDAIAQERGASKYLDEASLRGTCYNVYGASSQTTRSILNWMFLHLGNDTSLQNLLRMRVITVLQNQPATYDDRFKLPEVMSFINELLRYYPVLPLSIPHKTTCNSELNGSFIPENTTVYFNLYAGCFDEEVWEKPDEFRWNRFLQEADNMSTRKFPGFVPFSVGPRSCIGETMAIMEIFYITTRVLQRYKVSLPKGPGSADMRPLFGSVLRDPFNPDYVLERLDNINE